jgi:UDP-glucose 4-epimerase
MGTIKQPAVVPDRTLTVNGSLVVNVCTGHATALTEMIRAMGTITGRALDPARQPAREGDIRHSLGAPEAARRYLIFCSADSIESGLRSFLA